MSARGFLSVFVFGALSVVAHSASFRPNIVFILADDLGWNDVGFHGSDQVSTPNIDALAYNGVILNNHYVQPMCTPSRSALMTGIYPIHTGMQGLPTLAGEPNGLPLTYRLLPEYLQELGYVTRAVGKWHLGFYKKEYLPVYRGFQSHLGMWAGFTSYYDYLLQDNYGGVEYNGFDLHRDTAPAWEYSGKYATDLFTDEAVDIIQKHNKESPLFLYLAHLAVHAGNRGKYLEAPQEFVDRFQHIKDPNRRTYAAMVAKLDESVGRVVAALQTRYMLDNTIIVFTSDNGAPSKDFISDSTVNFYPNWGSNYPLKGAKETLWEGGVRSPTIIWSKQFQSNPRVYNGMLHMTDWLPTLYRAAGGFTTRLPSYLDGRDQWNSISLGLPSVRNETLLNINEKDKNAGLIAVYNPGSFYKQTWKIVYGSFKNNEFDGSYRDTRSPANPTYNVSAILLSLSHRALRTIYPTASSFTILNLRATATVTCQPANNSTLNCWKRPCLFDLERDPCETTDVAYQNTFVTEALYNRLVDFRATLVPQTNQPADPVRSDPRRYNNTWSIWSL
ncbi:arylsulfatase B-like isoform X1 [Macrosteles quadrilineatus]|uniref:arylsulfatase B-like isoform X1 n=1 Tax=Macrosteles quadrilineatus TaxID=74068 RepID=UPI0023E25839|nr:arylsulfatase B-like isoform X1 [Macrosteles quadrilineatus]